MFLKVLELVTFNYCCKFTPFFFLQFVFCFFFLFFVCRVYIIDESPFLSFCVSPILISCAGAGEEGAMDDEEASATTYYALLR